MKRGGTGRSGRPPPGNFRGGGRGGRSLVPPPHHMLLSKMFVVEFACSTGSCKPKARARELLEPGLGGACSAELKAGSWKQGARAPQLEARGKTSRAIRGSPG